MTLLRVVRRVLPIDAPPEDRREIRARLTRREVDRHGDLIEPAGLDLEAWLGTGAVVLANHDTGRPVARDDEVYLVE